MDAAIHQLFGPLKQARLIIAEPGPDYAAPAKFCLPGTVPSLGDTELARVSSVLGQPSLTTVD